MSLNDYKKGFLVLETGETYAGKFLGGQEKAGEVVFNTSHSGYEEMATDPSYYSQILVTTASMQGNYAIDNEVWESEQLSISGFVCLEMQKTSRDSSWLDRLSEAKVPVMDEVDTRAVTLRLRSGGAVWGAIVQEEDESNATQKAKQLIDQAKDIPSDWCHLVSCKESFELKGDDSFGPKVAVIDFGSKKNILRELKKRCSQVKVFPSRFASEEIKAWGADGIMLSNGPGDPEKVEVAPEEIKKLLGWRPIYGICMGHQVLSRALGGKTFKLKFGHRGSNHPVQNQETQEVCMTSQNHGYAVEQESLPQSVKISHINLNDQTVSGISCPEYHCQSVQFHPESHPGPRDAVHFFDDFNKEIELAKEVRP